MPADLQHHVSRIGPPLRHLPLMQLTGEIGCRLPRERGIGGSPSLSGIAVAGCTGLQAPRRIAAQPEGGRRRQDGFAVRLVGKRGIVGRDGELLRLAQPFGDPAHLRVLPPSIGIGAHLPFEIAKIEPRQPRGASPVAAPVEAMTGEAGIGRPRTGSAQGDHLAGGREPAIGRVVDVGTSRDCRQQQCDPGPSAGTQEAHPGGNMARMAKVPQQPLRSDLLPGVALPKAAASILLLVLAACKPPPEERHHMPGASPERGRDIIVRVGCASCHTVPGIRWPRGKVGPSLHGFAASNLISGRLPNRPDMLAAYVANAPAVLPGTTMPAMPVSEREARDVAAYLYTLEP